tara:strand:- start:140 stop:301 length:162 start_codon:yes stop_codon:yes gene_type:complete
MIILKKDNHYEHTQDPLKASEMVQNGYELIKGKSILNKTKTKPKKKNKRYKKK